ncbi:MAG: HAD superfamily hydrolase [Microgenomates group bacterium Gr01-1014_5]|nr:MAG: HAD superfamily hydrolase [Microgenomates group bacterium Gr01-1014_5]
MIKAVIFDLDGVLVDATEWHYEALNDALRLFGFEITREEHNGFYNGLPTVEKLRVLSEKKGLPQNLHEVIRNLKRKYTDEKVIQLCRPAYEKQIMLTQLKNKGYKLACCSNAQKYSVVNMLTSAGILNFFDLVIGNDEGYAPKPSPEIYLAAFEKLGINSDEAVIIEDAPHGVQAARASGAKVIEVKGYHDVDLSLLYAHKVI